MKKLFFSTILVLGFSVSGLANCIELKDLNLNENYEKSSLTNDADCTAYAESSTRAESVYYGIRMSEADFREAYAFYYNACIDAKLNKQHLLAPAFVG